MPDNRHTIEFRVRYAETDQMGTYYNSRPLEWFEMGRSELLRSLGCPYTEMERRGVRMPVSEAYVRFLGPAGYDDRLRMTSTLSMPGRARFRFDVQIERADDSRPVCRGYTVHVATDPTGKPIRPPQWLLDALGPPPPSQPHPTEPASD